MKKKIILPSLFVLNAFLVGMTPKTSKAGSVKAIDIVKIDTGSYKLNLDSCYRLPQSCNSEFVKTFKKEIDSVKQHNNTAKNSDSISYTISWQGGAWVKYTSEDGSGFVRTGGSRTWRNMNPGAIRPCEISRQCGACGSAGGFAVFPTEEHGMKALFALLKSDTYANLTIAAAIYKYAPPSDNNNPVTYQQKLARMTGLSLKKRINQLTPEELDRVALAIKEIEGWWSGKNEIFEANKVTAKESSEFTNVVKYNAIKQKQYSA